MGEIEASLDTPSEDAKRAWVDGFTRKFVGAVAGR